MLASHEALAQRFGEDMSRVVGDLRRGFRGSHGRILDLIEEGGTRPSDLAQGATISKQAVGQRIRELAERGWVELRPDPSDGRAVLVHRTAQGAQVRRRLRQAIATLEAEWAAEVGAERYEVFRAVLDELAQGHLPALLEDRAGSGDG